MFLIQALKRPINHLFGRSETSEMPSKLGTFQGVFVPSILQMIGVILYMRLGWITGNVGISKMLVIIGMSSSILFITGLSMTSIVSNMKMGSGGSYYIISRSLGIEFGSAIGILLCISQITSIALCTSGFAFSLHEILPQFEVKTLEIATLCGIALISYISTDLAIKTQLFIFCVLFTSIFMAFSTGSASNIPSSIVPSTQLPLALTFWSAFALFFPATTGIEAGMALSGDLKNPAKSLPIGTIAAIITAYVLYSSLAIFLSSQVSDALLRSHPLIIYHMLKVGFFIIMGIWAATLSSALGSILSAPRTMQAVARDGILPKFLSKGYGPTNQPRVATLVVFCLALILTMTANINQLLPILTMICLVSYGLINLVAFFESFIHNPSWRPAFNTPWYASLAGALGCLMAMFMINPGATLTVLFLVVVLCTWTSRRKISSNWDDMQYSIVSYFARVMTTKLATLQKNPKSWRPNILTFIDPKLDDKSLIYFAHGINQSKGFLTFSTILPLHNRPKGLIRQTKEYFHKFFLDHNIACFSHVQAVDNPYEGMEHLLKNYGLGPVKPNTFIIPFPREEDRKEAVHFIKTAFALHKNILLFKDSYEGVDNPFISEGQAGEKKELILWWGGRSRENFKLSLAISHLLKSSKYWAKASITIKSLVENEDEKTCVLSTLEEYKSNLRLRDCCFEAIIGKKDDFHSIIGSHSSSQSLTFIGLRPPKEDEPSDSYEQYITTILEKTASLRNVVFILAGEKIEFEKIFDT